jgi:hypothetical protein
MRVAVLLTLTSMQFNLPIRWNKPFEYRKGYDSHHSSLLITLN